MLAKNYFFKENQNPPDWVRHAFLFHVRLSNPRTPFIVKRLNTKCDCDLACFPFVGGVKQWDFTKQQQNGKSKSVDDSIDPELDAMLAELETDEVNIVTFVTANTLKT